MKKIFKMVVGYSACIAIQLVIGLLCAAITTPIVDWITDADTFE